MYECNHFDCALTLGVLNERLQPLQGAFFVLQHRPSQSVKLPTINLKPTTLAQDYLELSLYIISYIP